GLLQVLDPDVVRRVDAGAMLPGVEPVLRGARAVASGALAFQKLDIVSRRALVNGGPGVVSFAGDKPASVVGSTVGRARMVEMNILVAPDRVRQLDLPVVGPDPVKGSSANAADVRRPARARQSSRSRRAGADGTAGRTRCHVRAVREGALAP